MPPEKFTSTSVFKEKSLNVILHSGFNDADWNQFDAFFKAQAEKGFLFLDLDLRSLSFMNSQLLGLLVGLNSDLLGKSGQLRLIVGENSMIDQLLTISKLRRIMTVLTVSPPK